MQHSPNPAAILEIDDLIASLEAQWLAVDAADADHVATRLRQARQSLGEAHAAVEEMEECHEV